MKEDIPGPGTYDIKKGKGGGHSFGKQNRGKEYGKGKLGPGLYNPKFFIGSKKNFKIFKKKEEIKMENHLETKKEDTKSEARQEKWGLDSIS